MNIAFWGWSMKKKQKIILKDSQSVKHIVVEIDTKNNKTTVFSGFSTWENLALLLEGVGITAKQCILEGINKKKVYDEIKNYIVQALNAY